MGALSWLYRVSGQTIYRDAARGIWTYLSRVHGSQGTLSATSRDGLARGIGFLEDYAFCAFGLLSLYEATLEPSYLSQAQTLCRQVLTDFTDPSGGFFLTPQNADPLLIRPKDTADGALPSGNTMMAWNLVRLSHLTREDTWQRASEAQMAFLSPLAASYPTALSCLSAGLAGPGRAGRGDHGGLGAGRGPAPAALALSPGRRGHHSGTAHGRLSPAGRTDHLLCL